MRRFDYKLPAPEIEEQFGLIDDVEGHPAYQPGVFDSVQIDELDYFFPTLEVFCCTN